MAGSSGSWDTAGSGAAAADPLHHVVAAPFLTKQSVREWDEALGGVGHAAGCVLVLHHKLDRMGYTGKLRLISQRKRKITEDDVRHVADALDARTDDGRRKLQSLRAFLRATAGAVVDIMADDGVEIRLPPVLEAWHEPLDYPAFVRMGHGVDAKLRGAA